MMILAMDTCLAACSVAILSDGRVLAWLSEPTERGHQEMLAPMTRDVMAIAGVRVHDIDRIGVTVGPGSFTGLRVGLAFAKGLALTLGRPCAGVGVLEALAHGADRNSVTAAAIDAGRGRVYLQLFADGRAIAAADVLETTEALARILEIASGREVTLVGPGAGRLSGHLPTVSVSQAAAPDPRAVARLAARGAPAPLHPMYLRPPDAVAKVA